MTLKRRSSACLFVAVLALTSLANRAAAQTGDHPPAYESAYAPSVDDDTVPPGHHVEKSVRKGWIIAGSIVTGVMYSLGVAASSSLDSSANPELLYVPVLGPWIAMAALGGYDMQACESKAADGKICPEKTAAQKGFAIIGLGQAAGIGMILVGALWKSTRIVPDVVTRNELTVAPFDAAGSPSGVSVSGRY